MWTDKVINYNIPTFFSQPVTKTYFINNESHSLFQYYILVTVSVFDLSKQRETHANATSQHAT